MLTLRALGNPEAQVDGTAVSFPTRHAAQALFSLALAPTNQLNIDELGDRLCGPHRGLPAHGQRPRRVGSNEVSPR